MTVSPDAVLEVRDLHVYYGPVQAVHGLGFRLGAGQVVALLGANGAGKTTTLEAVMGLNACTGQIVLSGRDIGRDSVAARARAGLALVPEGRELFADMSVEENLSLGAYALPAAERRKWREGLREIYALFPRLKERRRQWASTLSGGERQMLAIGRALMLRPKVLMLDEPSLGLAPLALREIFSMISRLKQMGVSIVLVEQNARAALDLADWGYVIENGKIALEGAPEDLRRDPRLVELYLGGAAQESATGAVACAG